MVAHTKAYVVMDRCMYMYIVYLLYCTHDFSPLSMLCHSLNLANNRIISPTGP